MGVTTQGVRGVEKKDKNNACFSFRDISIRGLHGVGNKPIVTSKT